jgi:hypothetical protein
MIIDIPKVGQVEFPDSMSEAEINKAAKKLYDEAGGEAPKKGTMQRAAEIVTRGAAPAVTGAALGGAVGGPGGAVLGSMALPLGDALNSLINLIGRGNVGAENLIRGQMGVPPTQGYQLPMPSQVTSQMMTQAGLAEPESRGERMLEAGSGAVGSTLAQLPALARLGTQATSQAVREISGRMAQAPVAQTVVSAPAAGAAQYVTEATGSPLAGMAAGVATGAAGGTTLTRRPATKTLTQEQLAEESTRLFAKARDSGVLLDSQKFVTDMDRISRNLREEGYTAKAYPKIASALDELQSRTTPKDFVELQSLRKMIKGAQASVDPAERRLASILVDEFDDYIIKAPDSSVIGGSKEAISTWKEARTTYSKLKKAEIFEDMFANAELDKSKFVASGEENSMAQQLRQLAKNDKKMRLFSAEEQKAITQAAKGGTLQNLLKFYGRFAPTGPITGAIAGAGSILSPMVGIPLAAGAAGSRVLATDLRRSAIENLMEQMRLGAPPELLPRTFNVPTTSIRGLLSTDNQVEQTITN